MDYEELTQVPNEDAIARKLGINPAIFVPLHLNKEPELPFNLSEWLEVDVKVEHSKLEYVKQEDSETEYFGAEQKVTKSSKSRNSLVKDTKRGSRRGTKKQKTSAGIGPGTPRIPTKEKGGCFRDHILSRFDPNQYSALTDSEPNKKLIELSNKTLPSQIERFEFKNKSFIIIAWLTTIRIFEYYKENYIEVKRIPERYIEISSRLVTSLRYDNKKLYVAYLKGCKHPGFDNTKPYLEIRELNGQLIGKPYSYDQTISMIRSDHDFIYLMTISDVVYIHYKKAFNVSYKVTLKPFITSPLVEMRVESFHQSYDTKLRLLFTSANELVLSNYDAFEHRVIHCFRFEGPHKIVSIEKVDHLYIIHRRDLSPKANNSANLESSRVEFGFTSLTNMEDDYYFIHELTYSFANPVVQIKAFKENLYIFGLAHPWGGGISYQVGCIYMPSPKPQWVKYLEDEVDESCRILVNNDNIAIIKSNQRISCFKIDADKFRECKICKINFFDERELGRHTADEHESIFTDFAVFKNKYLQDLGASVFKKMVTADESDAE